jgi:cyclopropane-fatty-acyl-phospholipid synthase
MFLLSSLLRRFVRKGRLQVLDADGRTHLFEGTKDGPSLSLRIHDKRLHHKLFFNPELYVGEAYMDGQLTVEEGVLEDLFALYAVNQDSLYGHPLTIPFNKLSNGLRALQQLNRLGKAQQNVAHHYDLSGELYDLFLDEDRQYSCAYFIDKNDSLETAQLNKKRRLAAKMCLEPGQKVLDIGSGWGGLGLYLAHIEDLDVTGVTLSKEQHARSNQRAKSQNLTDRVRFDLRDYRLVDGPFDRIVSVGMLEHVGLKHLQEYFQTIQNLLSDDGVAVVHCIGNMKVSEATSPWVRKSIFPGGYTPSLSEIMSAVERTRLWVADVEVLRVHYGITLQHWFDRFQNNRAKVAEIYDERFCRMWEFYLLAAKAQFTHGRKMVFQLQLTKRRASVPLTRYYMNDAEEGLIAKEAEIGDGQSAAAD